MVTTTVDVADAGDVERAAQESIDALGRVDILVANAGITGPNVTTWVYPIEAWKRVIEVNLNGAFFCSRALVPHMMSRGYGRIVNMASIAGSLTLALNNFGRKAPNTLLKGAGWLVK